MKKDNGETKIRISRNTDGMYLVWDDRQYHLGINWGIRVSNSSGYELSGRDSMGRNAYVFAIHILLHESYQDDQNKYDYEFELPVLQFTGLDSFVPQIVEGVRRCFSRTNFPYDKLQKEIGLRLEGFYNALASRMRDMKHNIQCITQVFEQPVFMPKSIYGDPESELNLKVITLKENAK